MMKFMRKQEGFTLIELLIVIVIVGILAGLAVPRFLRNQERARRETCRGNLHTLENAVESFNAETGAYPADLNTLTTNDPPYLRRVPQCPAGPTPYNYASDDGTVTCAAAGVTGHNLESGS